jgi:CubicO group peptidase (beta-lactamase class C family)
MKRPGPAGIVTVLFVLFAFGLSAGCGLFDLPETEDTPAYPWTVVTPESQGVDPDLLSQAFQEGGNLDYLRSLLVARNGFLVGERYYRGTDMGDPRQLRSATKSITSILVGIARRQGRLLDLEQPILDFFPEYGPVQLDARMAQVTIRHLLMMTSGIASDWEDALPGAQYNLVDAILRLPLSSSPGAEFRYSSLGSHLLSVVLQRAIGIPLKTFAWNNFCQPLGISIPEWATDRQGNPFGGSGMSLLPRDMARIGQLYLEGGMVDEVRIVDESWVAASLEVQVGGDWNQGPMGSVGYGYQWWSGYLAGEPVDYAFGYSGQFILLFPRLELVVVATSKLTDDLERADDQATSVMTLVQDHLLPAVASPGS